MNVSARVQKHPCARVVFARYRFGYRTLAVPALQRNAAATPICCAMTRTTGKLWRGYWPPLMAAADTNRWE